MVRDKPCCHGKFGSAELEASHVPIGRIWPRIYREGITKTIFTNLKRGLAFPSVYAVLPPLIIKACSLGRFQNKNVDYQNQFPLTIHEHAVALNFILYHCSHTYIFCIYLIMTCMHCNRKLKIPYKHQDIPKSYTKNQLVHNLCVPLPSANDVRVNKGLN